MTTARLFATCPRGLEPVLAEELTALGATEIQVTEGGVQFAGDEAVCYRVNLESRVASRVLWRVLRGRYGTEQDVYRLAFGLPWRDWFDPDQTLRVNVVAKRCPLKSLEFITLKIKDAVCDKFRAECGRRPSIDTAKPDVRVHAFFDGNAIAIYVDTSGESLFKRGYRKAAGEAPLRENLAAGILRLAGWKPGEPLLDPMCGSGTFLLEAAMMALDIAPGRGRRFGFERLKNFDAGVWRSVQAAARSREKPMGPLAIFGSDIDQAAVDSARRNLQDAGLADVVQVKRADILEVEAPAPGGVLVANPPYGVRIGEEEELARLYPLIGDVLKRKFAGWRAYFFTGDLRMAKLIRLSASRRTPLYNGAVECRLFEYKMVEGGMRGRKEPGEASPG